MNEAALRAALAASLGDDYAIDAEPFAIGGMAVVIGATDRRHDRRVAIKVMRAEQAAIYGTERFLREIRLTANFQHPHILPLLDSGRVDLFGMAVPYFVMPLVRGQNLRTRLDLAGALPMADALAIARDVADGLQYAHDRGVLHRDIKPENILLGDGGDAQIADFGVARVVADTPVDGALTGPGTTVGTLAYMSPEQLSTAESVGPAADQFGLAAVLFEMLAGRPPFEPGNRDQVIAARLSGAVPGVRQFRPEVPAALEAVVAKGLARAPDQRYGSVREFMAAVGAAATAPARPRASLRRWAAVIVGLGVLGAGAAWVANRPARTLTGGEMIVMADIENLTADSTLGRALRIAATVGLQQSSSFSVYPRERLRESLRRMGRPARDTVLSASLAQEIAYREGGRAVLALSVAQVGDRYTLAGRLLDPGSGAELAVRRLNAAQMGDLLDATDRMVWWARDRLGDPRPGPNRSLPLVTTASVPALRAYAEALSAYRRGQFADADRQLTRAIELDTGFAMAQAFRGSLNIYNNDIPNGLKWLRAAASRAGRLTEVEQLNVKAQLAQAEGRIDDWIEVSGELATRFPSIVFGQRYAEALRLNGRAPEAVTVLRDVVRRDSTNPESLYQLANALAGAKEWGAAIQTFEHLDQLDSTFLSRPFANLEWGRAYIAVNNLPAAERVFRRLTGRADSVERARGFRSLAYLDLHRGRYADAVQHLHESIKSWIPGSLSEFRDQVVLADAELTRGRRAESRATLDRIFAIFQQTNLQAAAVMFGGHQFILAGQLGRARLLLDSLAARAGLRPDAAGDQAALALLRADLALAEGRRADAAAALASGRFDAYGALGYSLLADLAAGRGRLDSAVAFTRQSVGKKIFGLEIQTDAFRAYLHWGRYAEAAADTAAAVEAYGTLAKLWADGDPDLPPLREARQRLAALGRRAVP